MAQKTLNTLSKSSVGSIETGSGEIQITTDFVNEDFSDVNSNITELNTSTTDEIEILEVKTRKNGVEGIEGELLINQDINPIFQVDVDGNILVSDSNVEDKYEINEMGELIFKF